MNKKYDSVGVKAWTCALIIACLLLGASVIVSPVMSVPHIFFVAIAYGMIVECRDEF